MNDLIKFGLSEGQDVLLEYDDGSRQLVQIERTQVTNGLMGVRAIPRDADHSYHIIIDTSTADGESNGFPLYRGGSLTAPSADDQIPSPSREHDPSRWVLSISRPDQEPIETA